MTPQILEQKVDVGRDVFDRQVTATRYFHNGRPCWRIESLPSSARDDGEQIFSLSDDNIRQLELCLSLLRIRP